MLQAVDMRQDNPWIYTSLSRMYQKTENWEKALETGWNAVVFAGDAQEDQHVNFGYLLYECADEKGSALAAKYAERWINAFPDNKEVAYMANAILNEKQVKQADSGYVKKIFDTFAPDFDDTLESLEYQVPSYLAEAVKSTFKKEI